MQRARSEFDLIALGARLIWGLPQQVERAFSEKITDVYMHGYMRGYNDDNIVYFFLLPSFI